MQYDFAIDPIIKTRIVIFKTDAFYLARSNLASTTYWNYYKGNFNWTSFGVEKKRYSTKEEAESDCKNYLNFLKECGYDVQVPR